MGKYPLCTPALLPQAFPLRAAAWHQAPSLATPLRDRATPLGPPGCCKIQVLWSECGAMKLPRIDKDGVADGLLWVPARVPHGLARRLLESAQVKVQVDEIIH